MSGRELSILTLLSPCGHFHFAGPGCSHLKDGPWELKWPLLKASVVAAAALSFVLQWWEWSPGSYTLGKCSASELHAVHEGCVFSICSVCGTLPEPPSSSSCQSPIRKSIYPFLIPEMPVKVPKLLRWLLWLVRVKNMGKKQNIQFHSREETAQQPHWWLGDPLLMSV